MGSPAIETPMSATITLAPSAAAAMATARLQGASAETATTVLGIAASQSSGLRENFGTMMKPFHAGRAAQGGLVAALRRDAVAEA